MIEALISEGLADHFSTAHTGLPQPIWTHALDPDQLREVTALAEDRYDAEDYDHIGWFFGQGQAALPRWAGYTLGYRIVGDYLERHPTLNAATLAHAPAADMKPEGS